MKVALFVLVVALMPANHATENRKHPGPCDPYSDVCLSCTDCSSCRHCHVDHGFCATCLRDISRSKPMGRLTPRKPTE